MRASLPYLGSILKVHTTSAATSQKQLVRQDLKEIQDLQELKELKEKLLLRYSDIFKSKLEPDDRIKTAPVKMDLIENHKKISPRNAMNAAEIPAHLRTAGDNELRDMLEAGFLEPCNHPTAWCSRSFFVQKPGVGPTRVRMVSDFRPVNRILARPGYPYEGSTSILKRLDPEEPFFANIDLSSLL